MEIVPVLSLIVLVATIGTFILAVWAYIMFRIRERRGTHLRSGQPGTVEAEVVSPGEVLTSHGDSLTDPEDRVYRPEQKMMKYTSDGYVPVTPAKPSQPKKWR